MKILFLLGILLSLDTFSATCTTTSRNNYVTNQVLTSSALNADFNQLVTKANAFDGGCVTDGTLEAGALNATDFAPMLKGIKEGCKVSYSNASTISIGKCLAAVNGSFVTTTSATTASFGCTSCSAEVASTTYYSYIQTGSSGTTLTPLILTTAPNEDGYDNSGNKVLARFYNNASSDIDQYSIDQWAVNQFITTKSGWISYTPTFSSGFGTTSNVKFFYRKNSEGMLEVTGTFTATTPAAGLGSITLPSPLVLDTTILIASTTAQGGQDVGDFVGAGTGASGQIFTSTTTAVDKVYIGERATVSGQNIPAPTTSSVLGTGTVSINFTVPVSGWQ